MSTPTTHTTTDIMQRIADVVCPWYMDTPTGARNTAYNPNLDAADVAKQVRDILEGVEVAEDNQLETIKNVIDVYFEELNTNVDANSVTYTPENVVDEIDTVLQDNGIW